MKIFDLDLFFFNNYKHGYCFFITLLFTHIIRHCSGR